ncbi:MAG: aspartyl/asparaginyl beta-hydroxylase domain-containing protein [Planctomycetota bacterium]|nr:MAG: aspartyl/asparaginyl beta-hydroxylase domain-containing protein [Planctomycetota bacterium]
MFYDPQDFPFTAKLEAHWPVIRQEVEKIPKEAFVSWPTQEGMFAPGWTLFGFYAFGRRYDDMCEMCPQTSALVAEIPGMMVSGLSSMEANIHLPPHVGSNKAVLRCHMGVMVPEGCRVRVLDQTRPYEEGKMLIFDDTLEHEVWSAPEGRRVNLIFDIWKPWRYPGHRWTRLKQRLGMALGVKRSDIRNIADMEYERQKQKLKELQTAS